MAMRCWAMSVVAALSALTMSCGGGMDGGGSGGRAGGGTNGSGSGGRAGDGSGGSPGQTTDGHSFCVSELSLLCDLFFRCIPAADRTADLVDVFGSSVAECKNTKVPLSCPTDGSDCPQYNAVAGTSCVMTLATYSCDDLAQFGEPTECMRACDTTTPGTGGMNGTGGASGTGGRGTGGATGTGGRGTGGTTGTGGRGSGGMTGTGGRGTGGADGQLPLCPADYETNRNCPTAGVSCRLECASGLCGCTCQQVGDQRLWSCVIL